jgi:hypothetical protein
MERHRPKGKGAKNGLQGVPKAADRSALQQTLSASFSDFLRSGGFDILQRGSRKQVEKLRRVEKLLGDAVIHFIRKDYRPDAISLFATVPGQRWEIDILEDGEVEWECFKSDGDIGDEADLKAAVAEFAEPK